MFIIDVTFYDLHCGSVLLVNPVYRVLLGGDLKTLSSQSENKTKTIGTKYLKLVWN